ncbi:YjgN family protein [Roseateles sp. So40a]|uniref:YjgN family protein n=1 Tax=Roseateles sp. So40a TaxID=3400226 RepID=UPI003A8B6864
MHQQEGDASTGGLTGWPHSSFRKRKLEIRFTGSGSEYFRIWIVNLLLTIVTASLYWPFAKARRIRYFYANTLVDGHALAFHGDPWKMFRGHVLLLVLSGVYSAAGHFSPVAALVAFVLMALIWPALWRAGMQFRLGNTSWRGMRFGFSGSLKGAYVPMLPLWLLSGSLVTLGVVIGQLAGDRPEDAARVMQQFSYLPFLMGGVVLLMVVVMPWVLAAIKRYQHNGYRIASQQGELRLGSGSVYWLCLKALGLGLLTMLVTGIIVGVTAGVTAVFGRSVLATAITGVASVGLGYLVFFVVIGPFFTARLQNMVWNGTSSDELRFDSQLRLAPLAWLTLKNWLLMLVTIGLYRPFAVVHTTRLRLEAVSLTVDGDPEAWVASETAANQDATGEFAGDFFGIDMGL